jgi:hypothetical protein
MKINGPGQPPPVGAEAVGPSSTPPGGPDTAGRASGAGSAAGSEVTEAGRKFAENLAAKLEKTAAPSGPGSAGAMHGAPVALTDLVKEVEAGRLDARTAVDQLVERVVDAQLGPGAPAAVRDRVQAALRDALESDPLLAAKLGQLSRLTD